MKSAEKLKRDFPNSYATMQHPHDTERADDVPHRLPWSRGVSHPRPFDPLIAWMLSLTIFQRGDDWRVRKRRRENRSLPNLENRCFPLDSKILCVISSFCFCFPEVVFCGGSSEGGNPSPVLLLIGERPPKRI
jgi:hypothetical protein